MTLNEARVLARDRERWEEHHAYRTRYWFVYRAVAMHMYLHYYQHR